MRPFDQLSRAGQLRRLRSLALKACERYALEVQDCSLLADSFNSVFRVRARMHAMSALRVGAAHRIHAEGTEIAEVTWLNSLRRESEVPVPDVRATVDGARVITTRSAGVPEARRCVLFQWIAGRPLDERLTVGGIRAMGGLSALLHEHGASDPAGPDLDVLVADRVLYWRNEPRLDELTPAYGTLLSEAVTRAQEVIDLLWRAPEHRPHLVHGDLVPTNVMVSRAGYTVIDFQDLFWGLELQDLAISISALERYADSDKLVTAFISGYGDIKPVPDHEERVLRALVAARRIHQLNLGLNGRKPGLDRFIRTQTRLISDWMARP